MTNPNQDEAAIDADRPDADLVLRLREHAQLKELRMELERRVAERTRELEEANIRLLRQTAERHEAEAELKRLHRFHGLLLDSTAEGIYGVDRFGRCSFVNRAALSALGYDRDELLGSDIQDLIRASAQSAGDLPHVGCSIETVLREGIGCHCDDDVLQRKDGSRFAAEWSCHPLIDEHQISGAVVVFRDVTEARALAARLTFHASHDALTGLVNRREFELRLERTLAQVHHDRSRHTLLYMDLDQFKVVNDTCGHNAGDELLRQLAAKLQATVRRGDTLGRLGGDEFGVLLSHCDTAQAGPIAAKLLDTVQEFRLFWENQSFAVGVSIGIVGVDEDAGSLPQVLSAADSACYAAKEEGRNRMHVYQADDVELARRRGMMRWVTRLQQALDEDRFELYAQPIAPVLRPEPLGRHFEVLVRMRERDGGLVPPGAFFPAADRYDLTSRIDRWVVTHTLRWLAANPQRLRDMRLCSINLSGPSISDPSFRDFLQAQIRDSGVPASKLCFEITETAAVADLQKAQSFVRSLRERGCRFALDDFGSGMSSFAYLKNLPVDFLKIDGNFVRDILEDPTNRALTRSINDVGHVMGKQTIAEFVEDEAVLDALREMGVDFAQGYGIAKPVRLADLPSAAE